jgi:hypothetical protein
MTAFAELRSTFADPPREFGMMPQWFWNDDVEEEELLRQLREFHAKGCGGVMPHPRVGLSRRVGYLTPEFFRLVRVVVAEAARLGMKVVLYDEGSYPSGSAQGQVVAENPAWANRVITPFSHRVAGPASGYWRSNRSRYLCDRLVAGIAGRETASGQLEPDSLQVLPSPDGELLRYDLSAGTWVLTAVWNVLSGATIRGAFEEEDDEHALAPPAADILNPEAVASFIRHTHERYRQAIGDYFGTTVTAIFIDEPGLCGRGARRGGAQARPYTDGFLADLQACWDQDVRRWLPALWLDCGLRTAAFREAYGQALLERQRRVFYGPISEWCARYGIALTGHPPRSDESSAQRLFQWPGQDMVWWYVAPANAEALGGKRNTAIEGEHSTAPKGAHSMALLEGRRFTTVEVLGAYGWHLALDAVKWLLDWHAVRGINLFFPHACFYSVRGRRAFESEPDLGLHNPWWPHWGLIADYVRRLCWLFTDAEELCEAAILCDPDHLPWQAAKALYEAQMPFLYVGAETLRAATLRDGLLHLGQAGVAVSTVVLDPPAPVDPGLSQHRQSQPSDLEAAVRVPQARDPPYATPVVGTKGGRDSPAVDPMIEHLLAAFAAAGGRVVSNWTPETLPVLLRQPSAEIPRWQGPADLRLRFCRRQGVLFCLAVNEGEEEIAGVLTVPAGRVEVWDPLTGQAWTPATGKAGAMCQVPLRLERRQGLVVAIGPGHGDAAASEAGPGAAPGEAVAELIPGWQAFTVDGDPALVPAPGDWAQTPGFDLFTGTLVYRAEFALTADQVRGTRWLDLGQVGDIAEVTANGQRLGVRAWAPYCFPVGQTLGAGPNRIEVRVTNSAANARYGRQLPSGLLGPVRLRR